MKKITSSFPGLRILVVEDYFINQEVLKELLELMQCQVDIAEEGHQALEMATLNSYDLILMDLQLPGIDGIEVTHQIRKREKPPKHTLIVALTASAIEDSRRRSLEAGADDYVTKPLDGIQLEEVLLKYFADRIFPIKT